MIHLSASNVECSKSLALRRRQQANIGCDESDVVAQLLLQADCGGEVNRVEGSQRVALHQVTHECEEWVDQINPNVGAPVRLKQSRGSSMGRRGHSALAQLPCQTGVD